AMWHEINETITKDHVMKIYTGKKESYQRMIGFFNIHHKLRKKKGIKEQMIFPKEDQKLAKKRQDSITEVKTMRLNNKAEFGVWNDLVEFHHYPVKKAPRGFLIKDKEFAAMFEQIFDQLFDKAQHLV
ncbi:MAG: hypothetical protein V3V78_03480, partial [Candidatus Woesearchaeota archaeon]